MRLTMDDLIRSLRGFVHDLADGLEHQDREGARRTAMKDERKARQHIQPTERASDESRG